ncbi:hypothetical protein ACPCHT_09215 [Nucisporomicrobium flavum]|uniref:hypothetical protein n=1 Tax=Nucisporomicrobium flavum TaxID=2785915 RepID=UPI0018F3EE23|nr:hypothetical protein [Nucisporomicrobium flavum]
MQERNPNKIANELSKITEGRPSSEELVFDPRSGQLVVTSQPSPDQVIATDTAENGYFG